MERTFNSRLHARAAKPIYLQEAAEGRPLVSDGCLLTAEFYAFAAIPVKVMRMPFFGLRMTIGLASMA